MILDIGAQPLLEQYKAARDTEAAAINDLLAALRAGVKDTVKLDALTKRMEDTHNKAMGIFQELEAIRLDK
jgi:uncharacterized coiled-coil protein SlyX